MARSTKNLMIVLACFAFFAVGEQTKLLELYFTTTHSSTDRAVGKDSAARAERVSLEVAKPAMRWFPFIKYGETVHRQIQQSMNSFATAEAMITTTRTKLLVVGLCSTSKYEELANIPFESVER